MKSPHTNPENDPLGNGEPTFEKLFEQMYGELHSAAQRLMRYERQGHTLQPTELLHEIYARLEKQRSIDWQGHSHVMGVAIIAMRRYLSSYASGKLAVKNGGGLVRTQIDGKAIRAELTFDQLSDLDRAVERIVEQTQDPVLGHITFLKTVGLRHDEIAALIGVSRKTVDRRWADAKVHLSRELYL